jgi:hypothetical protein
MFGRRTGGVEQASADFAYIPILHGAVKPKVPDNFENDIWEKLRKAVDSIHESKPVPDSLEELYKVTNTLI